jgi:hypothetical protein
MFLFGGGETRREERTKPQSVRRSLLCGTRLRSRPLQLRRSPDTCVSSRPARRQANGLLQLDDQIDLTKCIAGAIVIAETIYPLLNKRNVCMRICGQYAHCSMVGEKEVQFFEN